jgi:hypothetical protein
MIAAWPCFLKNIRISVHNPFNQSTLPVFVQPSPLRKGFLYLKKKRKKKIEFSMKHFNK